MITYQHVLNSPCSARAGRAKQSSLVLVHGVDKNAFALYVRFYCSFVKFKQ